MGREVHIRVIVVGARLKVNYTTVPPSFPQKKVREWKQDSQSPTLVRCHDANCITGTCVVLYRRVARVYRARKIRQTVVWAANNFVRIEGFYTSFFNMSIVATSTIATDRPLRIRPRDNTNQVSCGTTIKQNQTKLLTVNYFTQ